MLTSQLKNTGKFNVMIANWKEWSMNDELRKLFEKWKAQGYVDYLEFKKTLPTEIVDQDQIDNIATMIKDMGMEIRMKKADVIDLDREKKSD